MKTPIIKSIPSTGCCSYLVACPETKRCLLVDPKAGQEAIYRDLIESFGWTLELQIDTHTHADHLSASSIFLEDGVALAMSGQTGVQRELRALSAGDQIKIGNLKLRVLEVPGHTPDSIAIAGESFVLTGDSLLIGGLARADFRGSDPEQLFDSVQQQLMSLPDSTVIFPGHEYGDRLFSTIGTERRTNPALAHASAQDYAASMSLIPGAGNSPGVDGNLKANLESHPDLPETPTNVATCCAAGGGGDAQEPIDELTCEEHHAQRREQSTPTRWLDVREPWEFDHGSMPGSDNLPLSQLAFELDALRSDKPIVFSCRSGARSMTAARTLRHVGVLSNPINLAGGILQWQSLGFQTRGARVE